MTIPAPILIVCIGLMLFFAVMLARMIQEASRTCNALDLLRSAIQPENSSDKARQSYGLEPERLEEVQAQCMSLKEPARTWWLQIEENLLSYTSPGRREGWYLAMSPREILRQESVSERYYSSSFYHAIPGVLTGLGLTATFVAILVALASLHVTLVNETEMVTGIKELIEGLSGKFLSSITGLLLSITFVLLERQFGERRLENAYEDLLNAISHLFPVITGTRLQLDLTALASRQAESLADIGARIAAFQGMVSAANESIPEMASALATDVEQFSDKLEELGLIMERSVRQVRR